MSMAYFVLIVRGAGGGMGVFMGMLFGALETPLHGDTMTARQHFVHAARTMGSKSVQMAKTFAVMGAIFSGTECLIEKVLFYSGTMRFLITYCPKCRHSQICKLEFKDSLHSLWEVIKKNTHH